MDYDKDSRVPFWRKFGTSFGQGKRHTSEGDTAGKSSKSASSKSEHKTDYTLSSSSSTSYNPDRDYPHSYAYQTKPAKSESTFDRNPAVTTSTGTSLYRKSAIDSGTSTTNSGKYLSSEKTTGLYTKTPDILSSSSILTNTTSTNSAATTFGSDKGIHGLSDRDRLTDLSSSDLQEKSSEGRTSPQVVRRRWSGDSADPRAGTRGLKRSSLQLYDTNDSKNKYCGSDLPATNKDLSGVRSVYTERILTKAGLFQGSGGRVASTPGSSSAYRPLVYTPGSPSPLRKSFSGVEGVSDLHQEKMASFMAIGRNSVFPDFLSSSRGGQHGHATPAYQDSSDSGIGSIKQRTLRLFGNNNKDSNKSNGSPLGSTKTIKTQTNGNKNTSANGNASRNIYRQPSSVTANRSRTQGADMRRKYFSQRLMWYSEADEDYLEREQLDRPFERRHHSDLGIASEAEQQKSDSNRNSTQDFIDKVLRGSSRAGSILKSASFDYYDKLDYKDLRMGEEQRASRRRSSVNSAPGSALRSSSPRKRPKMKTRFSDDVAVLYYDQEEKCTAVNSADTVREQEKLKDDKTTSTTVTEGSVRFSCNLHPGQPCGYNTTARAILSSGAVATGKTETGDTDNDNADKLGALNLTDNLDVEGNVRKNIFANKKFEIVAHEDGSHDLKLVVPIGSQYIRNRTSVKATSGGKRLIVIGYKLEGEGDLAHIHQYIEKMVLPHPIDAYSVKATMDREGNLKISAPVAVVGVNTEQNNAMARMANER